jgi:capsule polysaccharide export protein KpsE/RkpR
MVDKDKSPSFSDYIYILFKWKKFLFINLFLVGIITTGIVLLIPNQYKATTTVMIPQDNSGGLGGLSSLLGSKTSIAAAGSRLFGVSNTSEDVLLGILNSRSSLVNVIKKFHLMEYYEIDDNNMDKVIKAFKNDISADPNEYGMIEFSIINKDPKVSARIANYLVSLVDSLNIKFNIQRAKANRIFIEKRYLQNIKDLRSAEESLYKFQKKYGIVAVPEQLEVTVKAAAEIESQLIKKEMESFFIKQQYGENSPQYGGSLAEINLLKKKVQELKNSTNLSSTSNVLFPFKEMPNIAIEYLRNYREIEIQQSVLEIVMPMYEQAKVEEQKSMPTVMVIDKAVPPQIKFGPHRVFIILMFGALFLFLFISLVFIANSSINNLNHSNPLAESWSSFYKKMAIFYKVKV